MTQETPGSGHECRRHRTVRAAVTAPIAEPHTTETARDRVYPPKAREGSRLRERR